MLANLQDWFHYIKVQFFLAFCPYLFEASYTQRLHNITVTKSPLCAFIAFKEQRVIIPPHSMTVGSTCVPQLKTQRWQKLL